MLEIERLQAVARFEGVELLNYSPFVYANGVENIAITGEGTLDGNADNSHWWPWKGQALFGYYPGQPKDDARRTLFEMGEKGVPPGERRFGEGSYLRPNFIQPIASKNVLIEGVHLINSPMWVMNPVYCTNVTIRNVTVNTQGPNTDGCDPDSCADVLVRNCNFSDGDDCIAIKSGRDRDGQKVNIPSQDIVIQNCRFQAGHGGVGIGSETSGGVRHIFAEQCKFDSTNLEMAIRLKTNPARGGSPN